MWRNVLIFSLLILLAGCGPKRCMFGVNNPLYDADGPTYYEAMPIADHLSADEMPDQAAKAAADHATPASAPVKPRPAAQLAQIKPVPTAPRRPVADDEDHEDLDAGFNPYPDEPIYDPPLIRPREPGYRDRGRRHRDDYVSLRDDRSDRGRGNRHDRGDRGGRRNDRYDEHADSADGRRGRRARADREDDGDDRRRRRRGGDCYR